MFAQSLNIEGHEGCVNTVNWSTKGDLLCSGSDDTKVFHIQAALTP